MQFVRTRNPNLAAYESVNDDRLKEGQGFCKIIKYFSEWREEVAKLPNKTPDQKRKMLPSKKTLHGIEMTCHSIPAAIKFLLKRGAKFVMGRVFCQDPIEQHFSKQRAANGGNNNPTVQQYMRTDNALHLQGNLRLKRRGANTEDSTKLTSDDLTPLRKRPKTVRRCIMPTLTE